MQSRVPIVELVEAVAEADTLVQGHVGKVSFLGAFREALLLEVHADSQVAHGSRMVRIFWLHQGSFLRLLANQTVNSCPSKMRKLTFF
mgnify:CR=1 FL=1